jgi:hypothetical protein
LLLSEAPKSPNGKTDGEYSGDVEYGLPQELRTFQNHTSDMGQRYQRKDDRGSDDVGSHAKYLDFTNSLKCISNAL